MTKQNNYSGTNINVNKFKISFQNRDFKYMQINKIYPQYIHRNFLFFNSYDNKTWTFTFDLDMFNGELPLLKEIVIKRENNKYFLYFIGLNIDKEPVKISTNSYDNYSIILSQVDGIWNLVMPNKYETIRSIKFINEDRDNYEK